MSTMGRGGVIKLVYAGLLLFGIVVTCTEALGKQCPVGCYCKHKFVDCSALMDFPLDLARDTQRVRLTLMNIGEIPKHAFSYLSNLTVIEIEQSNIGLISGCAFMNIASLKELVFLKTVIGSIEKFAFNGLSNVKRLDFSKSRIGRLKSFAFYKLSEIENFNMAETNFQYFYSNGLYDVKNVSLMVMKDNNISDFVTDAFRDVQVHKLQATMNSFWNMHCGVLDAIFQSANEISFNSNTFYCNCSIHWMLSTSGKQIYTDILGDNSCHGPGKLNETAALTDIQFSDLKCENKKEDEIFSCDEVKLKILNPTCDPALNRPKHTGDTSDNANDGNVAISLRMSLAVVVFTVLCCLFI